MKRWILLVAHAALMAMPGAVGARSDEDGSSVKNEIIALRFDWPAGTEILVESSKRRLRDMESRHSDITTTGEYTLRIEPAPDGLRIRHSEMRNVTVDGGDGGRAAEISGLMMQLGDISPDYVVSPRGELLRIEGMDEIASRMRAFFAPMLDSLASAEATARVGTLMESVLREEALFNKAAEIWNAMIWTWAGEQYELGAVYSMASEEPSPVMPSVTFPMVYEFGVLECASCADGADPRSCVRIELSSYIDPEQRDSVVAKLFELMGLEGDASTMGEFDFTNRVVLLTEPGTLLPHRFETTRSISSVVVEGGVEKMVHNLDETRLVFRYAAAGD
ncbi:MAG: hypothetical protein JW819_12820 [Candidatus Krumholzibacteriota bacterium]|nr:hypothetical protein [Candidatus Krumholzibacteriota bacterium]